MAKKDFTLNGKKKSFFWDLKPPKSCDLIAELVSKLVLMQWNMVISCSSAFYPQTFCLTGIFFSPSKQETKSVSSDFLPASNPTPICPRVLRARQRSWHWHLLFCSELRDLPWPGSWGSGGGNALSCIPAGSPLNQPTGHLVSPPCYAHSLVWEVETFCRIQHYFFFFTFLQTRMREERRTLAGVGYYVACPHIEIKAQKNQRCHLARVQQSLGILKSIALLVYGDCGVWLQIQKITKNPTKWSIILLSFSAKFIPIKNQSYKANKMGFMETNLFCLIK